MPKPGTKVTPAEIRRYEMLRAAGWRPAPAAEAIGRSVGWAHGHEKAKRIEAEANAPKQAVPAKDLSMAVDLVLAEQEGDSDTIDRICDRYQWLVMPELIRLVMLFATERANALNRTLSGMLEGEPEFDELRARPITPKDILNMVPTWMSAAADNVQGYPWMPPRAESWVADMISRYPELQALEDDIKAAIANGDSASFGKPSV